ncbi:MAG: ketoacyl-ACP synthase III [Sedimentisphaerales bacterium]|nr:ketoacyl-ACP synthase III [Sedimentisphaerales bacterium]
MKGNTQGTLFSRKRRAVIKATGRAVPGKVLNNQDLEKLVDTSDEWITSRTGIKERHVVVPGESTASLALQAAQQALAQAHLTGLDIDMIICATITPEMVFPATACFVQAGLGNNNCCAFDVSAACSGFTYAMGLGGAVIGSGQYNNVMILASETLSTITDYHDRGSCILFGDGAGVAILCAEENSDRGLLYSSLHADGGGWETLCCKAYGSRNPVGSVLEDPNDIYMTIHGRETYQLAVRRIVELINESYEKLGISNDDVKMIIPHQMNARIIESVIKRLSLPQDKMFVNIDRYGNTSSASIAIALDEALRDDHLQEGDLIVLVSFGAGLTWGINVIRL